METANLKRENAYSKHVSFVGAKLNNAREERDNKVDCALMP